jgi:hypothetical protein
VKHRPAPQWITRQRDRIRHLGFDPNHLTPEEQEEFIELQTSFAGVDPNETFAADRAPSPDSGEPFRRPLPSATHHAPR